MRAVRLLFALLASCTLVASAAHAQTAVVNPKTVEFDPSADHNALTTDGQAMVQRYDLQVYLTGAAQPVSTASLGKPAPDADGKIRIDFSTILVGWPLANGNYEARVAAVGPTGTGQSDPSNPFTFQNCAVSLGSTSAIAPVSGGSGTIGVVAATGCGWAATSNAAWVRLAAASGSGNASLSYTVDANTGAARTALVTVGGQGFTIDQAAPGTACTYAVSPASVSLASTAGTANVTVTAGSGCAWSASGGATWLTWTRASGSGTGTATFSAAVNTTTTARSVTLTIAGKLVTVTQAGATAPLAPQKVRIAVIGG